MNTSRKSQFSLSAMVCCSLLVALEIILSRWLSIQTPLVHISFAFVPLVLAAMLYGPGWGCAVGGIADFLGAQLFPVGGYFPGFTLTNALCGLVHGLLLYQKDGSSQSRTQFAVRSLLSVSIVNFVLQMCLNTYWLILMGATQKGYLTLLATRFPKYLVMVPIQFLVIGVIQRLLVPALKRARRQAQAVG